MHGKQIVLTLDAGGTNFVFSAISDGIEIVDPIKLPSNSHDLGTCLNTILTGFDRVKSQLMHNPIAISFAFPGPADYPNGIIGDLPNLPAFRGGVALGPLLMEKFKIPVFINNDGDLFAYGEAIYGFLPEINKRLALAGNPKQYKNLLGITLGTGFGAGIVRDGNLFIGDNSIAAEIWLMRNKLQPQINVEEHGSIRGIRRIYFESSGIEYNNELSPKDIYEIALGIKEGNKEAAIKSFSDMAVVCGDAISNAITLIDGMIVIGGGLSGAADLFLPKIIDEMNSNFIRSDGSKFKRLIANVYNLEDKHQLKTFTEGSFEEINVYGSSKKIKYDPESRIGIGISKLGASKSIALGAYAFALKKMNIELNNHERSIS